MKFNIYNKWDTLDTVVLGSFFTPDYFENSRQKRICEEILEDLEYIDRLLNQQCTVHRPKVDGYPVFNLQDQECRSGFHRPPIYPRDSAVILGDTCVTVADHPAIKDLLNSISDKSIVDLEHKVDFHIDAPSITMLDDTVILDRHTGNKTNLSNLLKPYTKDLKHKILEIDVVHDGRTAFVSPNAMVTLEPQHVYEDNFPSYDILYIENAGKRNTVIDEFNKLKRFHTDPTAPEYDKFLDRWEEICEWSQTIFDVNLFMLDPHTALLTNNCNKDVTNFLRKHNIDIEIAPFRHRYLLEGGLHCMTLDLIRG